MTHTLDFQDLYTSGHWDQVLHHWVMMNIRSDKGEQAFQDRLNKAIARMDRDDMLAAFAEKTVPLLVEKGKDDLLPTISNHLETRHGAQAALSGSVKNMIASVKILTGTKGPDLVFKAPVCTQTGVANQDITSGQIITVTLPRWPGRILPIMGSWECRHCFCWIRKGWF